LKFHHMHSGVTLVNGAGGFLGSAVAEFLASTGHAVRATDLPGTNLGPARRAEAEVVEADLLDRDALHGLFKGVTGVVNVAGLFNYSLPYQTLHKANVELTRNMCEQAMQAGVERFVHISSIAVYGRPERTPVKEDDPRNARNNYERTKREGEDVVLAFAQKGLPAVSLRPAGIYGPRSRYGQAAFMALLALIRHAGVKKIPVMEGGPLMHHVHVRDVAGAAAAALDAPPEKLRGLAVNVADDNPITQGELFRAIMPGLGLGEAFSYRWRHGLFWPFIRAMLVTPEPVFGRMNAWLAKKWKGVVAEHGLEPALSPRLDRDFLGYMACDYVLDTARLKTDLGYDLVRPDPRTGLSETVERCQEKRWLPVFPL